MVGQIFDRGGRAERGKKPTAGGGGVGGKKEGKRGRVGGVWGESILPIPFHSQNIFGYARVNLKFSSRCKSIKNTNNYYDMQYATTTTTTTVPGLGTTDYLQMLASVVDKVGLKE